VLEIPGAFRQVIVFNGHEGWLVDRSGTVNDLSGGTLEGVISSAYEASDSFLFPGRLAGRVELAGEEEKNGPALRLMPVGGFRPGLRVSQPTTQLNYERLPDVEGPVPGPAIRTPRP
jgi:hypothetical protein